jgi:site-specific recombinase XerD
MKDEWLADPLGGYEENARHLFGYPESTLTEYLRDLNQFREWVCHSTGSSSTGSESSPTDPTKLRLIWLTCSREDVERYLVHLSNRGLRATTINRKIASLNSFYVWAVHHRLVEHSPLSGIRKLKVPRRIPKFLTFEDIHKLLTYTGSLRRSATVRGKQVHAMVSILYYLGVRRAELVEIRFEHIEKVTDSEIYLHIFGKGDKQRLVPFPAPAFQAYENYIRYRPESSFPHEFISLHTRHPMSKYNVNNVCDQLSRKVQLSKKLTPHLLRHTFATHLHLKGQPIEHINALLGHESLDTTKIYCVQTVDMCSEVA